MRLSPPTRALLAAAVFGLAVAIGCTGVIDDPGTPGGGGTAGPGGLDRPGGGGTLTPAECAAEIRPGKLPPLVRLTRDEYDNTVRDLLGDDTRPARSFPRDETLLGFELGATVSPVHLELYMSAAEDLAASASVASLVAPHCDIAAMDDACAREVIHAFGLRAYRRPLEPAQVDRLLTVYRAGIADGPDTAMRMVIEAMLQSPYFLYRVELGVADPAAADDVVPLTAWERASRLSYLVWASMPDDVLLAAAAADELATADQLAAQARRMVEDPKAQGAMRDFYLRWLELDLSSVSKDPELFPEFDDALARSMETEIAMRIDHVLWEGEGTFAELMTAPYTFVDGRLAELYGIDGVTGDEFVQVDLDPAERPGLLTLPGLMAMHSHTNQSSPVLRGKFIRERILCQHLPQPPPDLVVTAPEPTEGQSTRDRFERHRSDPSCSSCHQLMDPIGYGFETFDAIGRFRTSDEGVAIDSSGEIVSTPTTDGTFADTAELIDVLSNSEDVQRCVTVQWVRNALRRPEGTEDQCGIDQVQRAFEESGHDLRELIVALVQSDLFMYRRAGGSEAP